jgi:prepilin-type N-terminal cleavage/methylation domain-containing protein
MNRSRSTDGWTLIEMLVVVIVTGILSAIALPSFLNQANKSREAEAVLRVGQIARDQQAFFNLNQRFAELTELDTNPGTTPNFRYEVKLGGNGEAAIAETSAIPTTGLRGAIAVNFVRLVGESGGAVSVPIVCKSDVPGETGSVRAIEDGYECIESGAVPQPPITEAGR